MLFQQLILMRVAAETCICADGGANRLYDAAPSFVPHLTPLEARKLAKPAIIAGDLDSISEQVRHFYTQQGTRIMDLSYDQDSTDLQKCLMEVEKQFDAEQLQQYTIIAAGQPLLSPTTFLHVWSCWSSFMHLLPT